MSERIAVDFDNTLTVSDNQWWLKSDEPEPDEMVIGWVREQYEKGATIFVHTARPESTTGSEGEVIDVRSRTEQWLKENNVPYHALVMGKLSADRYVDDKSIRPEEVISR